jgi:hypothetical protein
MVARLPQQQGQRATKARKDNRHHQVAPPPEGRCDGVDGAWVEVLAIERVADSSGQQLQQGQADE